MAAANEAQRDLDLLQHIRCYCSDAIDAAHQANTESAFIASQKYKLLNITPTSCSLLSLTVRKTAKLMKSPRRMKPIPATSASAKPQSEAAFRLQGFNLTSTTTTNTAPVWQGR